MNALAELIAFILVVAIGICSFLWVAVLPTIGLLYLTGYLQ